jgi:L,D-transpeptidase-like protein
MPFRSAVQNGLIVAVAGLFAAARLIPGAEQNGPILNAAVSAATAPLAPNTLSAVADSGGDAVSSASSKAVIALQVLASNVRRLSHPRALETAFRGYFAYKTTHPNDVKKPYLYFVDYGLPSTEPRGYLFDMDKLAIVDGPFMVAHGRGSSASMYGVPTRFSNANGSNATSLGLYLARELYDFHGKTAGRSYSATGLRLLGLSDGWNDNAKARGVVAHGAPYVTSDKAGRSEGCPALEPDRARKLLPKLAGGGMVFLFAPNEQWMSRDPWVAESNG